MSSFSRLQKYSAIGLGIGGGIAVYLLTTKQNLRGNKVYNSWTTNTIVPEYAKWNFNWDHREPTSLVRPLKTSNPSPEEENKFNEKLDAQTPKASRHYFLIRHGQYHVHGATDLERVLTDLGRKQAVFTGERLKTLQLPWTSVVISTMSRAQETGKLILASLADPKLEIIHDSILVEGAPIAPHPPVNHWRPEPHQFFQDGARIEAAFRKYFHRADSTQEKDSYTLMVCHANVIRYFVCRALQFPPEAWLRLSLNHASITWLTVGPSGRVILRTLGDSGFMPPEYVTSR